MIDAVAVFNPGSSNLKIGIFSANDLRELYRYQVPSVDVASEKLLNPTDIEIKAIGYRVVHGGREFTEPVKIEDGVLEKLKALIPLAPLHQPQSIAVIEKMVKSHPDIPHIACFDTAFHHTNSELERSFALPLSFRNEGIERYGFHGISYQYIASVLPQIAGEKAYGKVIVAHLGSGASMCAMENLKSKATTMGFSTLEGLMMGTRSGSLDPGVILHLIQQKKISIEDVSNLLYHNSGLKGVSGISADMHELEKSDKPEAKFAIELFCYQAARHLGSLVMCLGGLDVLVFTAGIGEHSSLIRQKICKYLEWLGVEIDKPLNESNASFIGGKSNKVGIYVIPTDEEKIIAASCQKCLFPALA